MKKFLIGLMVVLMSVLSLGDELTNGADSEDVPAVGAVISSIEIENVTDTEIGDALNSGASGLNMGIMIAGEDQDYTTTGTHEGFPHPGKIRITGAVNTTGNTIIQLDYDDQVVITNNNSTSIESITVALSYSGSESDMGSGITEQAITLNTTTTSANIFIHGTVTQQIPGRVGQYEGTIHIDAKYDTSSDWF